MKISIITPTLNSADFIESVLQSVLAQTFSAVEHIIVDGDSTDCTLDIVEHWRPAYEASGRELRVISGKDRGLYDAMSIGVQHSSGDVVGILNSDDYYSSGESLQMIRRAFEMNPGVEAVYGNVLYVDRRNESRIVRSFSSAGFSRKMMLFGLQPPHPTLYCSRNVYRKFGTYDWRYKISGDFDFMLRAIYHGKIRTQRIPEYLVTMRSGGATDKSWRSHLKGLWEHQIAYARNRIPSCILLDLVQLGYKALQLHPPKND